MRLRQDLSIALVLAVIGVGFGKPALARNDVEDEVAVVESAIARSGLSETETAMVRALLARAQDRERAGDEDGAARALADLSAILQIA